jgi:hypothetical protein
MRIWMNRYDNSAPFREVSRKEIPPHYPAAPLDHANGLMIRIFKVHQLGTKGMWKKCRCFAVLTVRNNGIY